MRTVVWALMQCWACGHVQTLARIRPCQECQGSVEVLQTRDEDGKLTNWGVDVHEYRKRYGINPLKRSH